MLEEVLINCNFQKIYVEVRVNLFAAYLLLCQRDNFVRQLVCRVWHLHNNNIEVRQHLNRSGLHLNRFGDSKLAFNIISALRH